MSEINSVKMTLEVQNSRRKRRRTYISFSVSNFEPE